MLGPVNSGNYLLIFARNPELGKVKTRLAKSVGENKALEIYHKLLQKTKDIALKVSCFRVVCYSNFVDFNDLFDPTYFYKDEQYGQDLGQRMNNAISSSFEEGAERVVVIGSDCYELSAIIIQSAFDALNSKDVVLGPAEDGGYYLIGMKSSNLALFENKEWGSSNVLLDTLLSIKEVGLSCELLETLNDVDTIDDLPEELKVGLTDQ
jgi:rSAM/selenodomain-associated transferase 1